MDQSQTYMLAKIEYLKKTISHALRISEQAHDILFKDSQNKQNELIASTYINKAISLISTAKAIYISNIEELERTEVEDIFNRFDIYESEFLTNLSTDHSHQWTDIEFLKFKDSVEVFI
ncbi:hypothetical protein [Clostridium estertheticum]|uniref:hypothetical protein n=1 Tax=Clostridium estertheticum TaxID=238834 RepID=UPI001C0D1F9B|nr:hypothetical protein [Clostridium estertheticum]MBU3171381.1 hypothetical protein [Clostridium estertheticum]